MTPTSNLAVWQFAEDALGPSNRTSPGKTPDLANPRRLDDARPSVTARVTVMLIAAIAAAVSWLFAQLFLPSRFTGVASFCAAWIALYPAAHFNGRQSAWSHCAGGAMVIFIWLLILLVR
jgi:putative Mn2+ efflux pump MntP